MKPGRIAAWAIAAVAVPGLAACSGSSPASSGSSPTASSSAGTSSPAQSPTASQSAAQGQTAGSGSLTPPGTHLAFGGPAGPSHKGLKWHNPFVWMERNCTPDFFVY